MVIEYRFVIYFDWSDVKVLFSGLFLLKKILVDKLDRLVSFLWPMEKIFNKVGFGWL